MPLNRNPSEAVASVKQWAGATVPAKWLDCNGAAVSRATYAALFAQLGVAYGVGDGATTFNLPDWRGRVPVGVGTGSGLTARARGAAGGAETHPLTGGENGPHAHGQTADNGSSLQQPSASPGVGNAYNPAVQSGAAALNTQSAGSGTAHPNMQPWGCGYWIIKALP